MITSWALPLSVLLCPAAAAAESVHGHYAVMLESRAIATDGAAASGFGLRTEVGAPLIGAFELAGNLSVGAALAESGPGESELAGVAARIGAVLRHPVVS